MGNLKSPRGYFSFSTWAQFISSEVSFHSSEVSFDSSEEFFILHLDISKYPRGNHFSPTQRRFDVLSVLNYCSELALHFSSQTLQVNETILLRDSLSAYPDTKLHRVIRESIYSLLVLKPAPALQKKG